MPELDSAILAALKLDPALTSVSAHGLSVFSSTHKITTSTPGAGAKSFFLKTANGSGAEEMFQGEYASLNAIHNAVPSLCPRAHAHGALSDTSGYFLATDFLNRAVQSVGSPSFSAPSLAQKLARLHTTPQPAEFEGKYGFPVATYCGETAQDNTWEDSWARFYGQRRLMTVLRASERNNGANARLRTLVEKTVDKVVPRLLGVLREDQCRPVVVHGDLWRGNASCGWIGGEGELEDVVFDPSACYGHNEYEMGSSTYHGPGEVEANVFRAVGIMKMFSGFGPAFFDEYHKIVPKADPVEEYEDRVQLYMLYHELNHNAIFGGGYRSRAVSNMKSLLAKYGSGP